MLNLIQNNPTEAEVQRALGVTYYYYVGVNDVGWWWVEATNENHLRKRLKAIFEHRYSYYGYSPVHKIIDQNEIKELQKIFRAQGK